MAYCWVETVCRRYNTSILDKRHVIGYKLFAAAAALRGFYNNAYYAKVGGVTTTELNRLEMKFLFGLDFRLHVNLRTFGRYCSQLEKEVSCELQIERPPRVIHAPCGLKKTWSSTDDSSSYTTTEIHIV